MSKDTCYRLTTAGLIVLLYLIVATVYGKDISEWMNKPAATMRTGDVITILIIGVTILNLGSSTTHRK